MIWPCLPSWPPSLPPPFSPLVSKIQAPRHLFSSMVQASFLCLDSFSPGSLHSGISSNTGSLDKSSLTRQSKEVHPYPNHYRMALYFFIALNIISQHVKLFFGLLIIWLPHVKNSRRAGTVFFTALSPSTRKVSRDRRNTDCMPLYTCLQPTSFYLPL